MRAQVGRLYGALAKNLGGVGAESDAHRRANADAIRLSSAFDPLIRVAILIGFTMTLPFGGRMAPEGDLEVGVLSVLVFMTRRPL